MRMKRAIEPAFAGHVHHRPNREDNVCRLTRFHFELLFVRPVFHPLDGFDGHVARGNFQSELSLGVEGMLSGAPNHPGVAESRIRARRSIKLAVRG